MVVAADMEGANALSAIGVVQGGSGTRVPLLFSKSPSPQLVRTRKLSGEQLVTRSMFTCMSQPSEPVCEDADKQMFEIIHDGWGWGGCYEDMQVNGSEFMQSGTYTYPGLHPLPNTCTQQTYSYTSQQE